MSPSLQAAASVTVGAAGPGDHCICRPLAGSENAIIQLLRSKSYNPKFQILNNFKVPNLKKFEYFEFCICLEFSYPVLEFLLIYLVLDADQCGGLDIGEERQADIPLDTRAGGVLGLHLADPYDL